MYISLVIVVGRLIRALFTHSPTEVMITEIPNPDFLLKICLDIYLVREAKDFFLEQMKIVGQHLMIAVARRLHLCNPYAPTYTGV
ncbi:hypothetical protein TELCIR_16405 [Teladorsagia circumcincta]|uniref:Piezo non-specific cation channel cap domain-containing protein n=1 Tax=Teladorsagia circumcincta TaxID=45464 RepID=A0A2G9TVK9_TELCI|nr:hypothetical protein TELCIR_16405 [Teladorsagia circumcincta]